MMLNKKNKFLIKKYTKTYFRIIVGTFIMAIGIAQFLLPNHLSTGGFAGIATIGYYLLNIPMGIVIIALNIPVFIISYFRMGRDFFIKSLVGTFSLSIFLNIFESLPALTSDSFLACIYGGILVGLGTAIVLSAKGSTGGSDLIANIIRTYKPDKKTGTLIVIIDAVIVGLNVLFFKEIEIALYSAIAIFLMGKVIDAVFEGIDFIKVVYIISKDYNVISQKIASDLKRGVTGISSKGMYTNEESTMLMCAVPRMEVVKVVKIVKKIDKNAFVVVLNAREVIGKGFKAG